MKTARMMKASLSLLAAFTLTACVGFVVVPVPLTAGSDSTPEREVRAVPNTQN